jgi:hypothetical protein
VIRGGMCSRFEGVQSRKDYLDTLPDRWGDNEIHRGGVELCAVDHERHVGCACEGQRQHGHGAPLAEREHRAQLLTDGNEGSRCFSNAPLHQCRVVSGGGWL